jgi:hypothetical protein
MVFVATAAFWLVHPVLIVGLEGFAQCIEPAHVGIVGTFNGNKGTLATHR